jgi:nucleotide-binding universal stress UspA family protein
MDPTKDAAAKALPGDPRVVVGVDGSPGSRAALSWAMTAAAGRNGSLKVVAAYPVDLYWTDPYLADLGRVDAIRADTTARVRAMVKDAQSTASVAGVAGVAHLLLDVVVAAGRPAEHLIREARTGDLLVVGSRGRGAVRSTLLGSVALHCVAHAPCDVVVVHQGGGAPGGRVVVGLDDTDASRAALVHALQEAERVGAVLDVVAVYQPLSHWVDIYSAHEGSEAPSQEEVAARARLIVDDVLAQMHKEPGPQVLVSADEGTVGEVLIQRSQDARMLVVGSHGRNQITGMVLGSVALHCVVSAACPVMVVHPPAHDGAAAMAETRVKAPIMSPHV